MIPSISNFRQSTQSPVESDSSDRNRSGGEKRARTSSRGDVDIMVEVVEKEVRSDLGFGVTFL